MTMFIFYILALVCSIPVWVIFFQSLSACLRQLKPRPKSDYAPKIGVLIPAHNESSNLIPTLQNLVPQMKAGDRLVVVADNCNDDTAELARVHGADVIERFNHELRGKGYALDYGVRYFSKQPPEILIIMDADCVFSQSDLQLLGRICHAQQRPVQPLYLMKNTISDTLSVKARIAEFAWLFKNRVRAYGYALFGMPCQLTGTGMAFPWQQIANSELANGNIVEDMKLGIELAKKGTAPVYCDEVEVVSYFPTIESARSSQSTRWEHGHLGLIFSESPRLMRKALANLDYQLFFLTLDLLVPPLSLLVVLVVVLNLVGLLSLWLMNDQRILSLALVDLCIFSLAIMLAWYKWARHLLTIRHILCIPLYILQKIPGHIKFVFKRQTSWIRTERK